MFSVSAHCFHDAVIAGWGKQVRNVTSFGTVFLNLPEPNLIPSGIVTYHADDRQIEPYQCIVVESGATECAITEEKDDLFFGTSYLRSNANGVPTPSVPSGPGSIQCPG